MRTYDIDMPNGEIITVSQEQNDFVTGLIAQDFSRVVLVMPETTPALACPNCRGNKSLKVFYSRKMPAASYQSNNDVDIKKRWFKDGWVDGFEKEFDCPVCVSTSSRSQAMLRQTNLTEEEKAWRLNFFEGEEGKGIALKRMQKVVSASPLVSGYTMLYGVNGTGKSGLLKSSVAQLATIGINAVYTTAQTILNKLNSTYSSHAFDTVESVIERYARIRFLAIDEIGRTSDTSNAQAQLFEILDRRYRNRFSFGTAFASNLEPAQFHEYFKSRLDDEGAQMIRVAGRDLRKTWQKNPVRANVKISMPQNSESIAMPGI